MGNMNYIKIDTEIDSGDYYEPRVRLFNGDIVQFDAFPTDSLTICNGNYDIEDARMLVFSPSLARFRNLNKWSAWEAIEFIAKNNFPPAVSAKSVRFAKRKKLLLLID